MCLGRVIREFTVQKRNAVIGYRSWWFRNYSVHNPYHWEMNGQTNISDKMPSINNKNGLYAFSVYESLGDPEISGKMIRIAETRGRVKLWGRIIEHEHGYRAHYACVEEVFE